MLIGEELVLLALEPDGRLVKGVVNHNAVDLAVIGALVAELALDGHLGLDDGRIRATGTRPDDPFLSQVLDQVLPHAGKRLDARLTRIRHCGWREVVDGLASRGVLGREKHPLRPTRHPVLDRSAQAEVTDRVRAAAAGDDQTDARTAVLLGLSGPCNLLEVVAPDRAARRHARERIDRAADLVPAAAATKHAIATTQAAVASAVAAAVSAGAIS